MEEEDDPYAAVPPSPIDITPHSQVAFGSGRFPRLPQLPGLDIEFDLPGRENEPLGSDSSEFQPLAASTQSLGSNNVLTDDAAVDAAAMSRLAAVRNWVNDFQDQHLERHRDAEFRLQRHASHTSQENLHFIGLPEIETVAEDSDVETNTNSEVIEIDDESEVETIVDSEVDNVVEIEPIIDEERPTNPIPPNLEQAEHIEDPEREPSHSPEGSSVNPADTPAARAGNQSSAPDNPGVNPDQIPGTSAVNPRIAPSTPVGPSVARIQEESPADFRSPKRKRVYSPVKPPAGDGNFAEAEDDGDTCPICFEAWTTSGCHRLASLKCGHLFGQSCIEKWLKGQGQKCPQCNTKAKRQDIRVLFAKTVKALDTTERDRALKDLEKEREMRRKVEMEGAQLRLQYQVSIEQANKLRLELETLKSQIRKAANNKGIASTVAGATNLFDKPSKPATVAGQFVLDKAIKIWDAGNCRVMGYSPSLATLVVSQPSASPLFPGFGVKKISSMDFKTSQYLTIHSKAIRDLSFHPSVEDGMLLSCGLDKKVKMTSLLSNTVVQAYDTPVPAWSCVWNTDNRHLFYAGLQNGIVLEFDIRNTDEPVQELNKEGSRSPVVSLQFLQKDEHAEFRSAGLLIGQLDRVSFLESIGADQQRLHILPLDGNLTSLCVEPHTRHILASYRPTARHPTIRHQLCEMFSRNISNDPATVDNVCSCNIVHTFHGGRTQTVLSRTLVLRHPRDPSRLLVLAGDESSGSVHMWDSGTGQLSQRLLTSGMIVDMNSFTINNTVYLAALSDKQCKVFKWT